MHIVRCDKNAMKDALSFRWRHAVPFQFNQRHIRILRMHINKQDPLSVLQPHRLCHATWVESSNYAFKDLLLKNQFLFKSLQLCVIIQAFLLSPSASMNIGSTAGIIGGVVFCLIILVIIIVCCCRYKKKKEQEQYAMG